MYEYVLVPWSWLEKFADGKTYSYLSGFLSEAKEAYAAEMDEFLKNRTLDKDCCIFGEMDGGVDE